MIKCITSIMASIQPTTAISRLSSLALAMTALSATSVAQVPNATPGDYAPVVYEPFNYALPDSLTPLNGVSAGGSTGFSGPWSAHSETIVDNGSLEFAPVPSSGGKISIATNDRKNGGWRSLDVSSLNAKGMLADGATLWMSAMLGYGSGGKLSETNISLALANNSFGVINPRYFINSEAGTAGAGVGVTMSAVPGKLDYGRLRAARFLSDPGTGGSGEVSGSYDSTEGRTHSGYGQHTFVVCKITWGATQDVIEVYQPDSSMILTVPISVLVTNVDQSQFDTLTFCRRHQVTMDEIRIGATYESVVGSITRLPTNGERLLAILESLKAHVNGTTLLTAEQLSIAKRDIILLKRHFADDAQIIRAAMDIVAAYDTNVGPLFLVGSKEWDPWRDNGLRSVIFHTMQFLFDYAYTPEKIAMHRALLEGFKFGSSAHFPGAVAPPAPGATHTAAISASFTESFGRDTTDWNIPARKPTGCYLSPGTYATVTVPAALVGKGYVVRVGAHAEDLAHRDLARRLYRITRAFPITSTTVEVSNPMGGGIYIEVPRGRTEGVVNVTINGAVRSPYFSRKPFHNSSNAEWLSSERNHPGPWADFQTEKYMMQVPSSWIRTLEDPETLMLKWDMVVSFLNKTMGFPEVRGKESMYFQADVLASTGAFQTGYPAVNQRGSDIMNAATGNKRENIFLISGPQLLDRRTGYILHEQGHYYNIPDFSMDLESLVNLAHIIVKNGVFGEDIDTAFAASVDSGLASRLSQTIDDAAVHWMTTFSFAPLKKGMSNIEAKYQHQGHAKYVDIARLFGWDCLERYFYGMNTLDDAGVAYPKADRDFVLRLSQAAGKDVRPLLHFWGVNDSQSENLNLAILAANLPKSKEIYDTLARYKSIVPADNAAFQSWGYKWYSSDPNNLVQPGTSGHQSTVEHRRQWDDQNPLNIAPENMLRNAAENEKYTEIAANQIRARVQELMDQYYPNGRPMEVLSIVDNQGGASHATGNSIIYTITFSKEVDLSTVDAADFLNAVGGGFSIASISKTSPNVLVVEVIPDGGGLFHFGIASGATVKDAFGEILDTTTQFLTANAITVDNTPPSPSPMAWQVVPTATSPTSVTMTAVTASDPNGVEYKFRNLSVVDGSHDSPWQTSPTYVDSGLAPFTSYTYEVIARDMLANPNVGTASEPKPVVTLPDSAVTTPSLVEGGFYIVGSEHAPTSKKDFNVSVFGGKGMFGGQGNTSTSVSSKVFSFFGDGTVHDYRFFRENLNVNDAVATYASGTAAIISDISNVGTGLSNRSFASVWTTRDPGLQFPATAPARNFGGSGSPTILQSWSSDVSGSIDISGLRRGTVYFLYGGYRCKPDFDLVMSGPGQASVTLEQVGDGDFANNEEFYIGSFHFLNAENYDTIRYTFNANKEASGSGGRFMGVVVASAVIDPAGKNLYADDFNRTANATVVGQTSTGGNAWKSNTYDVTTRVASQYGIATDGKLQIDGGATKHDPGLAWVDVNLDQIPSYSASFNFSFPGEIGTASSFLIFPRFDGAGIPGNEAFLIQPNTQTPSTFRVFNYRGAALSGTTEKFISTAGLTDLTASGALPVGPSGGRLVYQARVQVVGNSASLYLNGALIGTIAISGAGDATSDFLGLGYSGTATSGRALVVKVDDLVVTPENTLPVWNSNPIAGNEATEGLAYSGTLAESASDADGGTLTYAKVNGPAWLNVAANGTLSGMADFASVGANVFTVSVTDGRSAPVSATMNINVVATTTLVPNVIGQTQSSAASSLSSAGLSVGSESTEYSDTVAAGNIISQTVAGGTRVAFDTVVNLVVSKGIAPKLFRTSLTSVSSIDWTPVSLGQTYVSPVIIATPVIPNNTVPSVVTRIRNITAGGFEVKLDRTDNLTDEVTMDVRLLVVEEGVYTLAKDGVKMEAVKYLSTVTAQKNSWIAESRDYLNTYTNPVVVGQVMSANDARWSVFWSSGAGRSSAVDAKNLNLGKHVGRDSITTRLSETIGYIVIERGNGTIGGVAYEARIGNKSVQGLGDLINPTSYGLNAQLPATNSAALSQSGMSETDGSWAVLVGETPITPTAMFLYVMEDQAVANDRKHTPERVGYIIIE